MKRKKLLKRGLKSGDIAINRYHRFDGIQTFEDLENVIETMPQDEKTTLALGFYNYDNAVSDAVNEEIEAFELGFDGEDDDFDDFTDYVDDDYFYQEFDADEEFDYAHHSKRKVRGGVKMLLH